MLENQCCMTSNKTELRKKYKNIRNNIKTELRATKENLILKNFFEVFNNLKSIKTVFAYNSFSSEVATEEIIKRLCENNFNVLIPKCDVLKEIMYATVFNFIDNQTKNCYGIYEMHNSVCTDEHIDVILVPGICFDRFGNRIGFGKGYYDKFISSLNYKPLIIALCFSEQLYDNIIYNDTHDCKMDIIITDKETIFVKDRVLKLE